MSTTATPTQKFVVFAPDKTDAGALDRRYAVRAQHLEDAKPRIDAGKWKVAGMMTTPESIAPGFGDGPKNAVGSILIVEAETIEEVKAQVEGDIYYTTGVWDAERLLILPYFGAIQA